MGFESRVRFPGVNGLRFLAASLVLLHHIQGKPAIQFLTKGTHFGVFQLFGSFGVTFFFVLSGFLITYIISREIEETGGFRFKRFYIRRALRILPLYFLLTFLSFICFPPPIVEASLYLLVLPHFAYLYFPPLRWIAIFWSIGVEEHFYLFWPIFLVRFKNIRQHLGWGLLAFILFVTGMRVVGEVKFLNFFRIDCMAIGGLGAWIALVDHQTWKNIFFRTHVLIFTGLILSLGFGFNCGVFDHTYYSLLSLGVIFNVALNPDSILKLSGPFFNFMGEISYGIYAFSTLGIEVTFRLLDHFNYIKFTGGHSVLPIYVITFLMVVLFSVVSHFFFERKFLELRPA